MTSSRFLAAAGSIAARRSPLTCTATPADDAPAISTSVAAERL